MYFHVSSSVYFFLHQNTYLVDVVIFVCGSVVKCQTAEYIIGYRVSASVTISIIRFPAQRKIIFADGV